MDIDQIDPKGRQVIQSYGDGGFRVSGVRHQGSILVFPGRTLAWHVTSLDQVTFGSLDPVAQATPGIDILVVGTGARMLPLGASLRQELRRIGVTLEVMDSGAACRTFNVLSSEERRVAAAIIAVD
jgi:uncharacterized protein